MELEYSQTSSSASGLGTDFICLFGPIPAAPSQQLSVSYAETKPCGEGSSPLSLHPKSAPTLGRELADLREAASVAGRKASC